MPTLIKTIRFTVLLAIFQLSGCASVPNIPLDKSQIGAIKTASLLRISESNLFLIRDLSGLPGLAGPIGGAISALAQEKRAKTFIEEYNHRHISLSTIMVKNIQDNLAKQGVKVSYLSNQSPVLDKEGNDDYSNISTNSDVILNVWFGATGYIASAIISGDYEPWLVVNVRLLNSKTKKIIYQKTFSGGYEDKSTNIVFVPCGIKYRFATFDSLMSSFDRAIEGLTDCHVAIANKIASDLK